MPEKRFYLCPVCCQERMVIVESEGGHFFVCENCGAKRGPLPDRRHPTAPEV